MCEGGKMSLEILSSIIADFHENGIPDYMERHYDIPVSSGKIITITGPRRAGKTYLMYQLMDRLMQSGKSKRNIIYINFEDERLMDINPDDILSAYIALYPEQSCTDLYFFFDEIQGLNNWEKFIRRLYDQTSRNIFITGSNSSIYTENLSSSLRGRSINYCVNALSFREFLSFNDIDPEKRTTANKRKMDGMLNKYLKWGGFPEIVLAEEEIRIKILQEYFNVMIFRDILENYLSVNHHAVKYFLKRIINSFSKEFSVNKIYNELKSANIRISKDTLYELLDIAIAVYFCKPLQQWKKGRHTINELRKIYLSDVGYAKAVLMNYNEMQGRVIENVVFNHIKGEDVFYLRNGYEVDFLINDRNGIHAIEVTKSLSPSNIKRETNMLSKLLKNNEIKDASLIVKDAFNREMETYNKRINIIRLSDFLLSKS